MPLYDYSVNRDHFKASEQWGLSFPCNSCFHRDGKATEHPCNVCDHNVNAEQDEQC